MVIYFSSFCIQGEMLQEETKNTQHMHHNYNNVQLERFYSLIPNVCMFPTMHLHRHQEHTHKEQDFNKCINTEARVSLDLGTHMLWKEKAHRIVEWKHKNHLLMPLQKLQWDRIVWKHYQVVGTSLDRESYSGSIVLLFKPDTGIQMILFQGYVSKRMCPSEEKGSELQSFSSYPFIQNSHM